MVFDGTGPLVKRCDGFDGSLWSNWHVRDIVMVVVGVLESKQKLAYYHNGKSNWHQVMDIVRLTHINYSPEPVSSKSFL